MRRFLDRSQAADLLLWLTITVPVFLVSEPPDEPGLPLRWVSIAAVPLLGLAVVVGRRHPVAAAAIPVGLGFAATPELYTGTFLIAQMLLAFLLGRRTASMRTGLLFCGGVCLVGLVPIWFSTEPLQSWLTIVGTVLSTLLVPWSIGRYARQHSLLVQAGWELAERLEREQDLIADRTRLLERSRIASDMHDSLGHELSLIALRAAALQVNHDLGDAARDAAGQLRESAARASDRLREIIGVLRQDSEPAPLLPSNDTIASLIERAAASGLVVTLDGELEPLPPMGDRAAYRLVQEALTNAAKHAPGAPVAVRLGTDAATGEAVVSVVNEQAPNGPTAATGAGGGHGLVSLDERIRLAGGRLHAQPANGGFAVTARLPLVQGAAATPPGARQELAQARRKVRRSMLDAIWLPTVAGAVLLALSFGYTYYTSYRSVLDSDVYESLPIGAQTSTVEPLLPVVETNDNRLLSAMPADPPGADECRFYRTTTLELSPAYRLCFTDGRLTHKDRIEFDLQ